MTKQDKPEISELRLVPVDSDIGKNAACVGYDGGFSLLEPIQTEFDPTEMQLQANPRRDAFKEFTFG